MLLPRNRQAVSTLFLCPVHPIFFGSAPINSVMTPSGRSEIHTPERPFLIVWRQKALLFPMPFVKARFVPLVGLPFLRVVTRGPQVAGRTDRPFPRTKFSYPSFSRKPVTDVDWRASYISLPVRTVRWRRGLMMDTMIFSGPTTHSPTGLKMPIPSGSPKRARVGASCRARI